MVNNSPTLGSTGSVEHREDAPVGWPQAQDELASNASMSVLLVDGHQPPAIVVSNNNSICATLQSSTDHAKLCDPYCGDAHRKVQMAGTTIEYKCHAGLQCFAAPITIGNKRDLAVIGGRAFVTSADYRALIERFRTGDLKRLTSEALFGNIIFSEPQRLTELAESIRKTARRATPLTEVKPNEARVTNSVAKSATKQIATAKRPNAVEARRDETLESEVERLRNELEYRDRFADSLQRFLERISSREPGQTYNSIINNSRDLLSSERVSLQIFDETSNQLMLKAAIGMAVDQTTAGYVRMGEGVSGEVIESGKALMVTNVDLSAVTPAPAERRYKTKSFISYPISIGGRKIGVLNVTDKTSGGAYDDVDLGMLEIIGPQVALALERAEWQERASEFQLMSITDPLTTLTNRRYLEERLTEELNRSKRYDYPMSFLMIDIDDFKAYNDNNGHQAGDLALQITAHCLKAALRSEDVASRYGGEEFCILLPQTAMAEAGVIADRIRQRVATTHFPHGKTQPLGRVSISVGVSSYSKAINSSEIVIAAADRALYKAKRLGKDRIEFYNEDIVENPESR